MSEIASLLKVLQRFADHFHTGHTQMSWKRTVCDDGLQMVHHDGDTIFFGDPNHKDPDDTERFDLIVELANSVPAIIETLTGRLAEQATDNDALDEASRDMKKLARELQQGLPKRNAAERLEAMAGAAEKAFAGSSQPENDCACSRAGFPGSCDNCDAASGPVKFWREQYEHAAAQVEEAKAYVDRAIASFIGDPADNRFLDGYQAALEVVRDEAFSPTTKSEAGK